MNFPRVSLVERPVFERVVTALVCAGMALGLWASRMTTEPLVWTGVLGALVGVVLLAASSLRGRDDTFQLPARAFLFGLAVATGVVLQSVRAGVLAGGALAGVAMAGDRRTSARQRLVAAAAGALGVAWALWLVPVLERRFHTAPLLLRSVSLGGVNGLLLGLSYLPRHLLLHADAFTARLERLGGEAGARLHRTWDRCRAALASTPRAAREELLGVLKTRARDAERLATTLVTLEQRLQAADRKDAEAQLASMRADLTGAGDAIARARLQSAALSLSDSLEHLDALERKRERLNAELKLKLAELERAALGLEAAQGEPAELKTVMLRLVEQAAA